MGPSKRTDLLFALLLVPADFFLFLLAGASSYYIRFSTLSSEIRPVVFELPFVFFAKVAILVAVAWVLVFALFGLYRVGGWRKRWDELKRVFVACSFGFFLVILFLFFTRELFSSRFIMLAAWFLAILYVSLGRLLMRSLHHWFYRRGIGIRKAMLVGAGRVHDLVRREIGLRPALGYEVALEFGQLSEANKESIFEKIRAHSIDSVVLLDSAAPKSLLLELYDLCDEHNVSFSFSADFFGTISRNFFYNTIADIPIIELRRTPLFGWGRILKRAVDIVGSVLALIIFSPLLGLTALAIKLDSRGPIIYKNRRTSPGGEFDVYKFRYMKIESCTGEAYGGKSAEAFERELIEKDSVREGPLYKIKHDPRKTRVGRVIERLSIDELPQFLNVLKGDMSLVGPRPHQPREVAGYTRYHKKVFAIKPGVTGMAQVSGRSDLDFDDEVRLDLMYIEHWSLLLDLIIILKTPIAMLRPRKNL